jgi:hypothetical protein
MITYEISQLEELDFNYSFIFEAHRLLKKGGILTYYSDEAEMFRPIHLEKIREAGFTEIEYKLGMIFIYSLLTVHSGSAST